MEHSEVPTAGRKKYVGTQQLRVAHKSPAVLEVGVLQRIHASGFGFAQSLTARLTSVEVFLNQNRIYQLGDAGCEGSLICMVVADRPDGKRAAIDVWPFDLRDRQAAQALWGRVDGLQDIVHLQGLFAQQPAALPFVLVILGSNLDHAALVRRLEPKLPSALWLQPVIQRALHLAPPEECSAIVEHYLQSEPARALDFLQAGLERGVFRADPSWLGRWLDHLWEQVPVQRALVLDFALQALLKPTYPVSKEQDTVADEELLTWSRRGVVNEEDGQQAWWELIASSPVLRARVDWPELMDAPSSVVRALGATRYPALEPALAILHTTVAWATKHAVHEADTIFQSLDDRDRSLAEKWVRLPALTLDANKGGQKQVEQAIKAQMQTARAAEKCAMLYLESLGLSVQDMAVRQLAQADDSWKVMDLQINGRHGVDVKNCRRTINGAMHSGRWKVKAFKADAAGTAVTLCGVSSPHTELNKDEKLKVKIGKGSLGRALPIGVADSMVVLGVTNAAELATLMREFSELAEIDMPIRGRLAEMPAWAWDYPAAHYQQRDEALGALQQELAESGSSYLGRCLRRDLPAALCSLMNLDRPEERLWDEQQREFLADIRKYWRMSRERKASAPRIPRLPWLYLFTLHSWMRRRLQGKRSQAANLKDVFSSGVLVSSMLPAARLPTSLVSRVGIVDPAGCIEALLDVLAVLDKHLPEQEFVRMSKFTLYSNGVLVARFPDGQRRTLLAHCGGRLLEIHIECGYWPLVYGKNESCVCGRLICPKCECCSDDRQDACPHQLKRRLLNSDDMEGKVNVVGEALYPHRYPTWHFDDLV